MTFALARKVVMTLVSADFVNVALVSAPYDSGSCDPGSCDPRTGDHNPCDPCVLVLVISVPYDPRPCHDRVIRFAILADG